MHHFLASAWLTRCVATRMFIGGSSGFTSVATYLCTYMGACCHLHDHNGLPQGEGVQGVGSACRLCFLYVGRRQGMQLAARPGAMSRARSAFFLWKGWATRGHGCCPICLLLSSTRSDRVAAKTYLFHQINLTCDYSTSPHPPPSPQVLPAPEPHPRPPNQWFLRPS